MWSFARYFYTNETAAMRLTNPPCLVFALGQVVLTQKTGFRRTVAGFAARALIEIRQPALVSPKCNVQMPCCLVSLAIYGG